MVLAQAIHLSGHSTIAKQKGREGSDGNADACKTLPPMSYDLDILGRLTAISPRCLLMLHSTVKSLTEKYGYSLLK
jgi:hypothetical protein